MLENLQLLVWKETTRENEKWGERVLFSLKDESEIEALILVEYGTCFTASVARKWKNKERYFLQSTSLITYGTCQMTTYAVIHKLVKSTFSAHFHFHPHRPDSGYRAVAPVVATRHTPLPVCVCTVKYPSRLPLLRLRTTPG